MFQIFCVRGAGRGASKQSSRKSKSCLHEIWSHRREQSPGQFHAVVDLCGSAWDSVLL